MKLKSLIIYICFGVVLINAQSRLDSLFWLQGNWTTEKWGGKVEEYWSSPNGNSIIGMFRLVKDDSVQFTEHWMLAEFDGKLALRLRHYNPDFSGWENKDEYVEFAFIEMGENFIQFEGLKYEMTKSGELKVSLEMKQEGKTNIEVFNFHKM